MKKTTIFFLLSFLLYIYSALHITSVFVHHKAIYLSYELLFLVTILTEWIFISKTGNWRSFLARSGMLHLLISIIYAYVLFYQERIDLNNTLTWLLAVPSFHFMLHIITAVLARLSYRYKFIKKESHRSNF